MSHNIHMHSDTQKRRSFLALLLFAGDVMILRTELLVILIIQRKKIYAMQLCILGRPHTKAI